MKNTISLAITGILGIAGFGLTGCQSDQNLANNPDYRTRPSVDQEMGGGMNLTGAGADNGASASGMDRAGGGVNGSLGGNSGPANNVLSTTCQLRQRAS